MKKNKDTRKIWLVEHPLHQYTIDVKEKARRENLKVVDAKFDIHKDLLASNPPKLTTKAQVIAEAKAKADAKLLAEEAAKAELLAKEKAKKEA